ncbi:unnamed protein product [Heterobilharzia americana]|nr:unnamed protein product [Heterobilharzia americana]
MHNTNSDPPINNNQHNRLSSNSHQNNIKHTTQQYTFRKTTDHSVFTSTQLSLPSPPSQQSSQSVFSNCSHKRASANLRERKRIRLINHAFNGLRSHLPRELLFSSALLDDIDSTIRSSVVQDQYPIVMESANKKMTSRLSSQYADPTNSYFRKQTISKVDVLRAAIRYIRVLQEIVKGLDSDHPVQESHNNPDQSSRLQLNTHPPGFCIQLGNCPCSNDNSDKSVEERLYTKKIDEMAVEESKL